jgi:molecular chaperone IbpA
MRTSLDLTPFRHASVGFDRLFDLLESGTFTGGETYPPFDLVTDGDDRYRITLAVAGFTPEEVDITTQQNLLIVSGRKAEQDGRTYVHRGIAARPFERQFVLGDYVKVEAADMQDGLLTIKLVRDVPEEMKPKTIRIGTGTEQARLTDQQQGGAANRNQDEKAAA